MPKKIAAILVLAVLLTLTACGGKGESPEQAVTNALTAIKNCDFAAADKYITYEELFGDEGGEDTEFVSEDENTKLLFKRLSFKILSSSVDGEAATVKAEITNIDMMEVLSTYFQQAMELAFGNAFSEDPLGEAEIDAQIEQILVDLLESEETSMVTSTVDIQLVKQESTWKINVNEMFQDAVMGGLLDAVSELE